MEIIISNLRMSGLTLKLQWYQEVRVTSFDWPLYVSSCSDAMQELIPDRPSRVDVVNWGCFNKHDGRPTGRRTILLWTNNMGGWSVARSDSPSCLLKQAPVGPVRQTGRTCFIDKEDLFLRGFPINSHTSLQHWSPLTPLAGLYLIRARVYPIHPVCM